MSFEELSTHAETLLREIIKHNSDATNYWEKRFENLSNEDDSRLRSLFGELEDMGMIDVLWANDVPNEIRIYDSGYTYAERKLANIKEKRKLKRREWYIAIVSAAIGAAIGLIPTIVQWIGGK